MDAKLDNCDNFLSDSNNSFTSEDEIDSYSDTSKSSNDISYTSDNSRSSYDFELLQVNHEEDFPEGSWLGNENEPQMRVRCPLNQMELALINTTCSTPKKMAMALINHLFSYDKQAGKFNDENFEYQLEIGLSPEYLYGIKSHLLSMFGITMEIWKEIRQVVEAKYFSLLSRHLEDTIEKTSKRDLVKRVGPAQLQFLSKATIQAE